MLVLLFLRAAGTPPGLRLRRRAERAGAGAQPAVLASPASPASSGPVADDVRVSPSVGAALQQFAVVCKCTVAALAVSWWLATWTGSGAGAAPFDRASSWAPGFLFAVFFVVLAVCGCLELRARGALAKGAGEPGGGADAGDQEAAADGPPAGDSASARPSANASANAVGGVNRAVGAMMLAMVMSRYGLLDSHRVYAVALLGALVVAVAVAGRVNVPADPGDTQSFALLLTAQYLMLAVYGTVVLRVAPRDGTGQSDTGFVQWEVVGAVLLAQVLSAAWSPATRAVLRHRFSVAGASVRACTIVHHVVGGVLQ
jgi:hypothetical protein